MFIYLKRFIAIAKVCDITTVKAKQTLSSRHN